MKRYVPLYALLICFIAVSPLQAEFPSTINYQGRLVSGTELVNAVVEMRFRLYTEPAGGTLLFESTNHVLVVDGLYATEIGAHTVFGTLQEALKNYPVHLEVEVDGDILSPRERFSAVPYALQAAPPSQGQNVSIIDSNGVETFYPSLTNAWSHIDSGKTLRLYAGDHKVDALPLHNTGNSSLPGLFLSGKKNIHIHGVGEARIFSETLGDYLFIQNSTNIVIEGITFDGLGPSHGDAGHCAMINFRGFNRNIRISNCRFTNYGSHGVSHLGDDKKTTHVLIEGCHFENGGQTGQPWLRDDGAAISGIGSYWTIMNNHIVDVLRGIEIEGPGPSRQSNILIANNTLRDIWSIGIMLFPSSGSSSNYTDITIRDNILTGKQDRPGSVHFSGSAIYIAGGERISMQGNVIEDFPYSYSAINLHSTTVDIRDCIIANNTVHNNFTRGIQLSQKGSAELSGCLVSGNIVTENRDRGIIVSGTGHSIINNIVTRNTAGSSGAGIQVYKEASGGPTDRIFVAGNHSHANRYGLHIREDVGEHVEIGPNYLHSNDDADFWDERE